MFEIQHITAVFRDIYRIGNIESSKHRIEINASDYVYHENFGGDEKSVINDIGIIKLERPVIENAYIKPIKITKLQSECYYGKSLTLSG